jgi:predicted Rossmann-fold nucleotide-binding protein
LPFIADKLERFPVIAMGAESWDYLRHFGRDTMMCEGVLGAEALELIRRADSPAKAVPIIRGA